MIRPTNNRVRKRVIIIGKVGGNRVGKRVKQTLGDLVIDLRQVFAFFFLFVEKSSLLRNRFCISLASVPISTSKLGVSPG